VTASIFALVIIKIIITSCRQQCTNVTSQHRDLDVVAVETSATTSTEALEATHSSDYTHHTPAYMTFQPRTPVASIAEPRRRTPTDASVGQSTSYCTRQPRCSSIKLSTQRHTNRQTDRQTRNRTEIEEKPKVGDEVKKERGNVKGGEGKAEVI